jgi:AcrR family transcriptional regulator
MLYRYTLRNVANSHGNAPMPAKIDRRIVRTRQLLRSALLSLIRERGFDVLTVQDIADRATLNRATFYLHYADKLDLLTQVIRDTMDEVSSLRPPLNPLHPEQLDPERLRQFFISLFTHVVNNSEFYRVMFGAGGISGVSHEIYETTFRIGIRWLYRAGVKSWHIPPDVIVSTLSGAYLGMVRWAVNQPTPPSPELMATRFIQLILPGILAAIAA